MTRWLIRLGLVAALLVQGYSAVRLTRYQNALEDGRASFEDDEFDDAVTSFEQARSIWDPDAEVWSWIGYSAGSLVRNPPKEGFEGDDEADLLGLAWSGYVGAVLRCPVDSWSWSGLAQIALYEAERRDREEGIDLEELERRGQGILQPVHAIALAAAKLAVGLEPSGYQEYDVLGRIYEATGAIDQARTIYVQSARMMPAPSFHTWGHGRRLLGGLYEAVLGGLDDGIARAPVFDRSMLLYETGRFARAQGDPKTALERLRAAKAQSLSPYYSYRALAELAGVLEENGQLAEAADELGQALRLPFDRPQVTLRLGTLEERLERHDAACGHLRDALRDLPSSSLRIETARTCRLAGDLDSAEQILREAARAPTADLALSKALLDFYRDEGRERTASTLARSWARDHQNQPEFQQWAKDLWRAVSAAEAARGEPPARSDEGGDEEGEEEPER